MTWQTFNANTPRFVSPAGGLLIEGQRTNGIRNPRGEGATLGVIGSGGVVPTNWTLSTGGVSCEIISQFIENGVDVIRMRFSGVAEVNQMILEFEATNTVVALPSQPWTASLFFRVVAAPLPGNYNFRCVSRINTSPQGIVNYAFTPNGTLARYSQTHITASDPLINRISWGFRSGFVVGQSYDFTIDIGWPQTEQGEFVSSPILPPPGTLAGTTRGADIVTAPFATLFPNNQLSLLMATTIGQGTPQTTRQTLIQVDAGSDVGGWAVVNDPARTNLFRNPRFEGATPGVIGSGGVAPTYIPLLPPADTTVEIIGVSVVEGLPCLELQLSTTTAVSNSLRLETAGGLSYLPNTSYRLSCYAQITGGSLAGFTALGARARVDGATASNGPAASLLGMSSVNLTRHEAAVYTSPADAATGSVQLVFTTTGAASVRFRLVGIQLEQGTTVTALIMPPVGTPGAASRASNTLTLTNGVAAETLGTFTPGTLFKVGVTLLGSELKGLLDGGSLKSVAAPSTPPTTVRMGGNVDGSLALFGEIRRARARAFAYANDALQPALTALPILP